MEQSFIQSLYEKCNKKCFAVKVSVKETVFKEGSLKQDKTRCRVILDKQCYGKSLEAIKLAVDELISAEKEKSFNCFLHKWKKGRSKEDLVKIYNEGTLDYDIEIQELNYIVLEHSSIFELTKIINEHFKFGWKFHGGVQTDSSDRFSERYYLQSLLNI